MRLPIARHAALAACLCAAATAPAGATTKGLNQIVTPDIQPRGVLTISPQVQNSAIGNSLQLQFELGITRRTEIAIFRGFRPGATVLNLEWGLVQGKQFLLSTGILSMQDRLKPEPFLEGGYYSGDLAFIAGIQRQSPNYAGVFGAAYQVRPRLLAAVDYMTGPDNYLTAGVTYRLSSRLTFNPAVYLSNRAPHRTLGYGVLSWDVHAW